MKNPFVPLFERRSGIGSPYDLLKYLSRGVQSSSGASVDESSALSVAAVLTCVSLRSRALSSLPVKVYERKSAREKAPADWHRAAKVLSQPNSWQTRAELFGMLEAHRVLRGNAYAWKNIQPVRGSDGNLYPEVVELIPLHPDRVEVLDGRDLGGPAGYKLTRKNGQAPLEFAPGEILHLKGLSTDGQSGRSVLHDMREAIGGSIATQEHANALWSRDATPSIALRHPKTLSEGARVGLEKSWEETYGRGADKKRVAVIEEGMEIEQLSLAPDDGQFLQTRAFTRAEIAGAFHVPPHMIGDTEKSTSWGTGIEQQQIGFLVFTLRPDLVLWEQRLTRELIAQPDKFYIEFSLDGLLRGDQNARAQFYRVMREVGAYSANDIRAFENMNPIDGGDVYLQPTNLAPLGWTPSSGNGAN